MAMQKREKIWAGVTTISSVILALCTFFYLRETMEHRKLFSKIVTVETKPRVFIRDINTNARFQGKNGQIVINSKVICTNCGRVEAKNILVSYIIYYGGEIKKQDTFGPSQYLFPEQITEFPIVDLEIKLQPEAIQLVKKAIGSDKELQIHDYFLGEPLILKIELSYDDLDGQHLNIPYEYQFIPSLLSWVYKEQSKSPNLIEPVETSYSFSNMLLSANRGRLVMNLIILLLPIVFAGFAVIIAILSFRLSRRLLYYQLLSRYSSNEMGKSIEIMWNLRRMRENHEDGFFAILKAYRNCREQKFENHFLEWKDGSGKFQFKYCYNETNQARRQVSHFYIMAYEMFAETKALNRRCFNDLCKNPSFTLLYYAVEWLELAHATDWVFNRKKFNYALDRCELSPKVKKGCEYNRPDKNCDTWEKVKEQERYKDYFPEQA